VPGVPWREETGLNLVAVGSANSVINPGREALSARMNGQGSPSANHIPLGFEDVLGILTKSD